MDSHNIFTEENVSEYTTILNTPLDQEALKLQPILQNQSNYVDYSRAHDMAVDEKIEKEDKALEKRKQYLKNMVVSLNIQNLNNFSGETAKILQMIDELDMDSLNNIELLINAKINDQHDGFLIKGLLKIYADFIKTVTKSANCEGNIMNDELLEISLKQYIGQWIVNISNPLKLGILATRHFIEAWFDKQKINKESEDERTSTTSVPFVNSWTQPERENNIIN